MPKSGEESRDKPPGKSLADFYTAGAQRTAMQELYEFIQSLEKRNMYCIEFHQVGRSGTKVTMQRSTGDRIEVDAFYFFDYLNFNNHPSVKQAAKAAIDEYGIGAAATPVIGGAYDIGLEFGNELLDFLSLDKGVFAVSLFATGFATNAGIIPAYMQGIMPQGCTNGYVVMDQYAHASIQTGAYGSGSKKAPIEKMHFRHNDMTHLEEILRLIRERDKVAPILICSEGVYSTSGNVGNVREIVVLAKKYGAKTLVDEAHSFLVSGDGRGVCAEQEVLEEIDLLVVTLSKAFSSIGGALVAKKEVVQYINFFARQHMFSTALPPAQIAAVREVLKLAAGSYGQEQRRKVRENSVCLRRLLEEGNVNVVPSNRAESWIIAPLFGDEKIMHPLLDFLQRQGVGVIPMVYPAAPKGEAIIRIFVTADHTREQLEHAAAKISEAAQKFGFARAPKVAGNSASMFGKRAAGDDSGAVAGAAPEAKHP